MRDFLETLEYEYYCKNPPRGRNLDLPESRGIGSKAEGPHGGRPLPADLQRETVRFAVGADCCGCLGCRETENLLEVTIKRGTRVLCPEHVEGWVNRG